MEKILLYSLLAILAVTAGNVHAYEADVIPTSTGDLEITFIGHGTLMFTYGGKVVHVDPWSQLADYGKLPKADLVLITHEHRDHLDLKALDAIRKKETVIVTTGIVAKQVKDALVMKNGDVMASQGFTIEAVAAYNLVHMRSPGTPYHPKGDGNGYIVTFADRRVYIAGDSENIPEMKSLRNIDVAFLPMNLPYTMTPEMVADAAKSFRPAILYPYHFGETDTQKLAALMKGEKGIEVRIRKMQ
ncbi:MAG TPA: MBL fold metallo-hydrolase [Syntrophales bacterium]|nr:MBL fold metallo-hydrolase [Syntrophales bacterium]